MLDLNKYRDVQYDDLSYNCLHFACDIYQDITGVALSPAVAELSTSREKRHVCPNKLSHFILIDKPKSPCIAVMRSPVNVHCGVYIDGKIIHLDDTGIKSQPPHIAQHNYQSVKYYDYDTKKSHSQPDAKQS